VFFTCGEGTQLIRARGTIFDSHIFIGYRGDHLYGIAGLISTLHLDGRTEP
jgi:hypothetical protein